MNTKHMYLVTTRIDSGLFTTTTFDNLKSVIYICLRRHVTFIGCYGERVTIVSELL
jgi:hypothetical protein